MKELKNSSKQITSLIKVLKKTENKQKTLSDRTRNRTESFAHNEVFNGSRGNVCIFTRHAAPTMAAQHGGCLFLPFDGLYLKKHSISKTMVLHHFYC
jgi:hypothetical protein